MDKKDLTSGKEANLTKDIAQQMFPVLSPDGERVAYLTRERDRGAIYVRPFEGGLGRRICDNCGAPRSWSSDGRFILYDRRPSSSIHALEVESGQSKQILATDDGDLNFAKSGYPLYSSGEPSYPWTRAVGGEDRGN